MLKEMLQKYIWCIITAIVFIIGIYLRFDAYLINNSFFTDEVLLALNIFEKDYAELFFPLKYFQSAPFLFLILSKYISKIAGYAELSLRFIPFISSLFSIYFFYKLASLFYKSKWCKTLALFTFCINYQLLFYTQTFKQYSLDVLFTTLFLYLGFKFYDKITTKKHFIVLGLIMLVFTYFSFPMLIIAASFISAMILEKKKPFKNIVLSAAFPAVGLLIYFLFNICLKTDAAHFLNYWYKGFRIFGLEIYKINFEFLFNYYMYPLIFLILLFAGFYYLYKRNRFYLSNIIFIIFYTLLAALLKFYPFERRLILFLLPVLILTIIFPLDNLKKKINSYIIATFAFIFFTLGYFNFIKEYSLKNISYLRQDVRPLLLKLQNKSKHDKIYVYYGAISSYFYYSMVLDIPKENVLAATYPKDENDSEKYLINDLNTFKKGNYYLFFIKGSNRYEKDIQALNNWLLENNIKILDDTTLNQTRLLKIHIEN